MPIFNSVYKAFNKKNYTISNIPTNDTNIYVNVAQSWKTIKSVKLSFTATYISGQACFPTLSSNNSSSDRYWMSFGYWSNWNQQQKLAIRWRLNWASDSFYRETAISSGTNTVEFIVNRDWNCSYTLNGTTTTYTATGVELNIIQTIMNLSNMNVYCSQTASILSWNKVDVEVVYS